MSRSEWLAEFDLRRNDLLALLRQHHRGDKRLVVDLASNLRAIEMIEDGCLIARSLAEHGKGPQEEGGLDVESRS